MQPETEQKEICRAAPSILTQDQKIQELEKQLAEEKSGNADLTLELRAIREAMRNAHSLDMRTVFSMRIQTFDRILENDQEFIDYWKNVVQKMDRRSIIKP